jgi:energy-converting hydrogenase Eha subunit E
MRSWSALVVAALLVVMGCSAESAGPVATDPCGRRVAEAADAITISEQVRLLDEAIYLCGFLTLFAAELDANSGVLNAPVEEFVRRRCELSPIDGTRAAAMCDEVTPAE